MMGKPIPPLGPKLAGALPTWAGGARLQPADTWSALEYFVHLGATPCSYAGRLERLRQEDRPQFKAFDWDAVMALTSSAT